MRCFLVVVLLLVCACDVPADHEEPGISRACVRSFAPTLEEWEARFGRVPGMCSRLDAQIYVQLVAAADMPCNGELGVNQVRAECASGDVLYLNQSLDDVALVDASVHGWVHFLNRCVNGSLDVDHLRAELWSVYGPDTVELQSQASAGSGECL